MDGTGSIRSEMPIERSREMRRDRACCGDHGNTSSFDALGIVLKSTSGRSVGVVNSGQDGRRRIIDHWSVALIPP